jgi:alkylated DNA repair dioxygenase AlkB
MKQHPAPDAMEQTDLFKTRGQLPDGFRFQPHLISPAEEQELVERLKTLPLNPFQFHGFEGKRRVVSFGWRYDFNRGGLQRTDDMPAFLLPLRDRAARFAGIAPGSVQHVLVTEYGPGAAIGWHKDRSVFGDVIGVSLLSECTFRLRRKAANGWERAVISLPPRSAYLLTGAVRSEWEHSIPAVSELRYSLTFRTLRNEPRPR